MHLYRERRPSASWLPRILELDENLRYAHEVHKAVQITCLCNICYDIYVLPVITLL